MVVVVVCEGVPGLLPQVVVVCFCTTPACDSDTLLLCATEPLSQVVVLVCVPGAAVSAEGLTWTTGGAAGADVTSFVLL